MPTLPARPPRPQLRPQQPPTLSPQQYNELEGVSPLLTNITLANAWLRELGAGAESAGVSVQRT